VTDPDEESAPTAAEPVVETNGTNAPPQARNRPGGPFGVDVLIPNRTAAPSVGGDSRGGSTRAAQGGADAGDGERGAAASGSDHVHSAGGGSLQPAVDPGQADDAGRTGDAPEGDGPAPVPGAHFAEVDLDAVTPNARQPRQVFDEEAMAELVHSIREIGLLQPIVVREVEAGRYELVMGERRWRAAREAGLERIPAIVRATDDTDMLRDALLENLHRSQLNPLEEAAAYDQLLKDFGCTHEELAERIGRSRPQVSNTLRLLRLPPVVQRRLAAGILSAGHARALLGLDDPAAQERLAQRIVAEGLSVRGVEEIVALGGPAGDAETPRKRRVNRPVAPRLQDLASQLSDRFETRVKVDLGRRKGRIVVEFASIDDLERIIGLMNESNAAEQRDTDAT
jgi:ParB family chromosome partitioning protein